MEPSHGDILVSIAFPLADLRPLLAPRATVLTEPMDRRDAACYLRRFGPARFRVQDGGFWGPVPAPLKASEGWHISAKRLLRVTSGQLVPPRLFADGLISARLEVLMFRPPPPPDAGIADWVQDLLDTSVELRTSRPGKRSPERQTAKLEGVGAHFRKAWFAATTPEPLRKRALNGPADEARGQLDAARRLIQPVPPVIVLVLPPSVLGNNGHLMADQAHVAVVRTGTDQFKTLILIAGQGARYATPMLRLARRAFLRLHCETLAVRRLKLEWRKRPPASPPDRDRLRALGNLADRLYDSSRAVTAPDGRPLPFLGEASEDIALAAEDLADLLEEHDGDAGRKYRRLAARILDNAKVGGDINIAFESQIGVQGRAHGVEIRQ